MKQECTRCGKIGYVDKNGVCSVCKNEDMGIAYLVE